MPDPAREPARVPVSGSSRADILARIRTALGTGPAANGPAGVPRPTLPAYRTRAEASPDELASLMSDRLTDYGCTVYRADPGDLLATVTAALTRRGARQILVPAGLRLPGLPDPTSIEGLPHGAGITTDDGRPPAELDAFDAVITSAALAIAETGTIVLDGSPGQGRRALTLIPDYHLCILQSDRIVALVPEALGRLDPQRPLTWISGPSATSDIELDRVQGVHGPRTLDVILT